MSNGQINGLDLKAARVNGKVIREIAMKDSSGQVARWRPDVPEYEGVLFPVFRADVNNRGNGNLADGVDFLHHTISTTYNRVVNNEIVGPTSGYAMDIITKRVSSFSSYIKVKFKTPPGVASNTRLQMRGGNKTATSTPSYQWISSAILFSAEQTPLILGDFFRQNSFSGAPGLPAGYLADLNEYRVGDEVLILQQGRGLYYFYNGVAKQFYTLTDEQWMPGYFSSLMLDVGHIVDDVEIGHWSFDTWDQIGDTFFYPDLTKLWNPARNISKVVNGEVMVDLASLTTNATHYSYNYSKHKIGSADQIVRGVFKAPANQTIANTIGCAVVARAGVDGTNESTPQVSFLATMTNGVQIMTIVNNVTTQRTVISPSVIGTITLPCEIELQCIGNRYFGLIDGNPVCEWIDTGNIVPVSADRSYYGWATSLIRSSATAATYSPSLFSIKGLTHDSWMPPVPKMLDIYPRVLPLSGGPVALVGEGLYKDHVVTVGGTVAAQMPTQKTLQGADAPKPFSDNVGRNMFPAKPAGTYDVVLTAPEGTSTLTAIIQYVVQTIFGHYKPMIDTTITSSALVYQKVPMAPVDNGLTVTPTDGVIVGLPKGLYRLRVLTSAATIYARDTLRHRLLLPTGATTPVFGVASTGIYDVYTDFTVNANGTVEIQFAKNTSAVRVIDGTFDHELTLLSSTKLPALLNKLATQLLSVASTFYKVTGMPAAPEFAATTVIANDEIVIQETKQYVIDYAVAFSSNNTASSARVVNQAGTVLATKGDSNIPGTVTLTLNKNDSIHLEASCYSTSTSARRTILEAGTFLKITPV